jgi:hypothetical protein
MTTRPLSDESDRGSSTLELAVLAPVLLVVIALLVAAGRVQLAGGSVESAARDAARQASIARTPQAAQTAALAAARTTLSHDGLDCQPLTVTVDTAGFATPIGHPAAVHARVSCTVALGDIALPGLPGSHLMHATASSPIDPYRSRTS